MHYILLAVSLLAHSLVGTLASLCILRVMQGPSLWTEPFARPPGIVFKSFLWGIPIWILWPFAVSYGCSSESFCYLREFRDSAFVGILNGGLWGSLLVAGLLARRRKPVAPDEG